MLKATGDLWTALKKAEKGTRLYIRALELDEGTLSSDFNNCGHDFKLQTWFQTQTTPEEVVAPNQRPYRRQVKEPARRETREEFSSPCMMFSQKKNRMLQEIILPVDHGG